MSSNFCLYYFFLLQSLTSRSIVEDFIITFLNDFIYFFKSNSGFFASFEIDNDAHAQEEIKLKNRVRLGFQNAMSDRAASE